jgi:hypothetical protein
VDEGWDQGVEGGADGSKMLTTFQTFNYGAIIINFRHSFS